MIDFEAMLALLSDANIKFVIVGGLAVTIHGSAYVTFDLDICYSRDEENLSRLTASLETVAPRLRGAPSGLPFRFDVETLHRGMNFTLTTDLGDIDLLGEIAGIGDYAQTVASSTQVKLYERDYSVLTLNALITAKRAAGRPKDLQLLPELEALREAMQDEEVP